MRAIEEIDTVAHAAELKSNSKKVNKVLNVDIVKWSDFDLYESDASPNL